MTGLRTLHWLFTAALFIAGTSLVGADDYGIKSIQVTANCPISITISGESAIQQPLYRTGDGKWLPLVFERDGNMVVFSLPDDALPLTTIVLDTPPWLQLPDDVAPEVVSVSVDAQLMPIADTVRLGHLGATPHSIVLTAEDADNPIDASAVKVSINGQPPSAFGGEVTFEPSHEGRRLSIAIQPGELEQASHSLVVSVPDATPQRNTTTFELIFTTAPLLANGDFELADDEGQPLHWKSSTWSSDAETEAEFRVIDDGHSGRALCIRGIAGNLNLVCGQSVDLIPSTDYVLSGYYKNDKNIGSASIIARHNGAQGQYSNMPTLTHAQDWTEFTWQFSTEPDNSDFMLYLRSSNVGTVCFDDLKLEQLP